MVNVAALDGAIQSANECKSKADNRSSGILSKPNRLASRVPRSGLPDVQGAIGR